MATFVDVDGKVRAEITAPGEYSIGRGPLLQITDKRVSRNHAAIKVEENGKVSVCSRHVNPSYYKKHGTVTCTQLEQNVWQELAEGDEISLLNYEIKELVFSVKLIKKESSKEKQNEAIHREKVIKNNDEKGNKEKVEEKMEIEQNGSENNEVKEQKVTTTRKEGEDDKNGSITPQTTSLSSTTGTGSISSSKRRKLPDWLLSGGSIDVGRTATTTVKKTPSVKTDDSTSLTPAAKKPPTQSAKTKRKKDDTFEREEEPTKKIKRIEEEKEESKEEEEEEEEKEEEGTSTTTVTKKTLPLCPYGKKCYRKNPAHFKEYSHIEKEEEEEEEEKPECPYGTSCYRKNPLHLKQYSHNKSPVAPGSSVSKRTRTSTRSTRGKKLKKSALEDDSDNDGEPNTYDYNDSFIDDENEGSSSTSYGDDSDEDGDWVAPALEDSEEDVHELISDAQEYLNNEKMQRRRCA